MKNEVYSVIFIILLLMIGIPFHVTMESNKDSLRIKKSKYMNRLNSKEKNLKGVHEDIIETKDLIEANKEIKKREEKLKTELSKKINKRSKKLSELKSYMTYNVEPNPMYTLREGDKGYDKYIHNITEIINEANSEIDLDEDYKKIFATILDKNNDKDYINFFFTAGILEDISKIIYTNNEDNGINSKISYFCYMKGSGRYRLEFINEDFDKVNGVKNEIDEMYNSLVIKNKTEKEIITQIVNLIANKYSYGGIGEISSTLSYGAVSDEIICSGYYSILKRLLNKAGISNNPVKVITRHNDGSAGLHIYNKITLSDGKDYFIDVTWYDNDKGNFDREYLLNKEKDFGNSEDYYFISDMDLDGYSIDELISINDNYEKVYDEKYKDGEVSE